MERISLTSLQGLDLDLAGRQFDNDQLMYGAYLVLIKIAAMWLVRMHCEAAW